MKIFITGASGFVGGAAARRFASTHSVFGMSRSEGSDTMLRAIGVQPVRCDLENIEARHLAGADLVIHSAAYVEQWGPKDAWDRINVGGTKRMLAAAKSAGVRRFIHIGTEAALVRGQDIRNGDETLPLAFDSPYPYCRTKALAEEAVQSASAPQANFTTIILRPRFIWGPGDQTLMPTIKSMAARGQWLWFDHGRAQTSTVHISNLVDAIELTFTKGKSGESYFILDEGQRTLKDMIIGMATASGIKLPNRSIPRWVGDLLGFCLEGVWRLLHLKSTPPLTRHAAMVMSRDCTLRGDKAKAELGYVPKLSVEQGLVALAQA